MDVVISKVKILNLICFTFLIAGCNMPDQNQGVQLNLNLEKYSYFSNDTLSGILKVTNFTPNTIHYTFPSSCQFGIKIVGAGITYIEYPQVCAQVITSLTLRSGESKLYDFKLPLNENNNNLPRGNYMVEAFLLNNNSASVNKSIKIY